MADKLAIDGGPKAVSNTLAGWPSFDDNAINAVEEVLRSGKVNYWTGPRGMEFEKVTMLRLKRRRRWLVGTAPFSSSRARPAIAMVFSSLLSLSLANGGDVIRLCEEEEGGGRILLLGWINSDDCQYR